MGFPPELWFEEDVGGPGAGPEVNGIPGRFEHLFGAIKNPTTGEPHANAEVARMSAGAITEEGVEGIRTGRIADPTVGQVAALAAAFGVSSAYLLDRGKEPPVLDEEALDALADETASAILRESAIAPEEEGDRPRDRAAVRRPTQRRGRPVASAQATRYPTSSFIRPAPTRRGRKRGLAAPWSAP